MTAVAPQPTADDEVRPPLTKLKEDGYVVIEGVLPGAAVADLHRAYMARLEEKMARLGIRPLDAAPPDMRLDATGASYGAGYGGNHDFNRWNMHVPSCLPFLDSRVIADPAVLEVVRGYLGEDCFLWLAASDTCFPRCGLQPAHIDGSRPALTVNVPLVDVTEENGPTEVWPGTHLRCDPAGPDWFKAPGAYHHLPSRKLCMPAGSVVVRDHRMLHRGTPNRSSEARPMLSLLYGPDERARVPYHFITNAGARAALFLRNRGRRRRIGNALLGYGHLIGGTVEILAQTDRDYRRRIPSAVWAQLTPGGKRVLRFADLEEGMAEDYAARRSLGALSRVFAVLR